MQPPLTDREQQIINSYRTQLRAAQTRHGLSAAQDIAQTRTRMAYGVSAYVLAALLERSDHETEDPETPREKKPRRKTRLPTAWSNTPG